MLTYLGIFHLYFPCHLSGKVCVFFDKADLATNCRRRHWQLLTPVKCIRQRLHFNRPYHWPCSTNGLTRPAVLVCVMNLQFPLLHGAISHWSFLYEKQDRSFFCWPTVGMIFVEWIRWVSSLPCYEMARLWWNDPPTSNEQSIQKISKNRSKHLIVVMFITCKEWLLKGNVKQVLCILRFTSRALIQGTAISTATTGKQST